MRKHGTRALMTFWKFLSRKIIELHFNFNLHTTVSINTVNLFIHCPCRHNYNDYIILNLKIVGGGGYSRAIV